jgi:hypothetical protein
VTGFADGTAGALCYRAWVCVWRLTLKPLALSRSRSRSPSSALPDVSRLVRAASAGLLVIALGGCELILAEPTPRAGATCPAWRGGCVAVFDLKDGGAAPPLRSETQLAGNVAKADRMRVPACDTAPWICQMQGSADVLTERYFGGPAAP